MMMTCTLVQTLNLSDYMVGRLISGMAVTDKHELVVVDLRAAYLVDAVSGRLIRVVGSGRAAGRLLGEPIGAATAGDGRLVFSDRADQTAKLFSARGHHVRTVAGLGLSNVAGVAVARPGGDVYVAGSGSHGVALVRGAAATARADTVVDVQYLSDFVHPYSVAVSPATGDVIVGDDHAQTVGLSRHCFDDEMRYKQYQSVSQSTSLQCFDTVGWASRRASGLYKLSDQVLVWWLRVRSDVQIVCIWSS